MYNEQPPNNNEEHQGKEIIHYNPPDEKPDEPETDDQQEGWEYDELQAQIDALPDNFPDAVRELQDSIAPKIAVMSPALQDYYIDMIKKKFRIGKLTIKKLIEDVIRMMEKLMAADYEEEEEELPLDDEGIGELVHQLCQDPQLFKEQMDMVNQLGVINERLNIGLTALAINSCKLPMRLSGSDALGLMNCGLQGAGKSVVLNKSLPLYPKAMYFKFSSGSPMSIVYMKDKLQHRALILEEAYSVQKKTAADNRFVYSLRSLLSEGVFRHQVTKTDEDGVRVPVEIVVKGPMSFVTTSIHSENEIQLDDRMFFTHPDSSTEQTRNVLKRQTELATGQIDEVDEKELLVWKIFYYRLEPCKVIIPFADKILNFLLINDKLPHPARRAYERVLSSIKTITLTYQYQRVRDEKGRVKAEMQDYAMAWQLIDKSFRECLGDRRHKDSRVKLVEVHGPITPKKLAEMDDVSVPAITPWAKQWLEKGVIRWVDAKGNDLAGNELRKAKSRGHAYLAMTKAIRLPTPFQLTEDPRWYVGGDLYELYDLGVMDDVAGAGDLEEDDEEIPDAEIVDEEEQDHGAPGDLTDENGDQNSPGDSTEDTEQAEAETVNAENEDSVKALNGNADEKIKTDDTDFDLGIDLRVPPE